jgi:hypothetical protein
MNEPSGVMVANSGSSDSEGLLSRALAGDERAFAALFDGQRERLRWLVRLRLDRHFSGRVDSDGVLQDPYLEARKRLPDDKPRQGRRPVMTW